MAKWHWFWDKGRKELEEFCRIAKEPTLTRASSFNWHIHPQPSQMLRVSVALAFRRAVLKNVYTLLRGRDLETGQPRPERRAEQFSLLQEAQAHVLDLTNWSEFIQCLERAGFRGAKMISSENAILFSYAMWLIGRVRCGVPLHRLREVIARWFFMAHTTGRYSGSFESRAEQDFGRLKEISDADGFCQILDRIIGDTLTSDFWTITLPNELATPAARSPALFAYYAALNIHDAETLLASTRVRARLDPALALRRGIERHHLFPRNYLRKHLNGADSKQINQIANMALVEWSDNVAVSDKAPAEYWPSEITERRLSGERLAKQRYWHALPDGWEIMAYDDFLEARRKLMAKVVRDAFAMLNDPRYTPEYEPPSAPPPKPPSHPYSGVKVADLLDAGLLTVGTRLMNEQDGGDVAAIVLEDGRIELDGQIYDTPSGAAGVLRENVNGWRFWSADTPDGLCTLAALRDEYVASRDGSAQPDTQQ